MVEESLSPRLRIINTMSELLEQQGYYGTGLNQIIQESQAPKGSLYHYFPDGKEDLAAQAIEIKSRMIAEHMQATFATIDDPAEAVRTFFLNMAQHMQNSHCNRGGPIAAVALETASTSERLRQACFNAYERWRVIFEEKLLSGGFSAERARVLSTLIVAAVEGGVILSRTKQDTSPLEEIVEALYSQIKNEMASP